MADKAKREADPTAHPHHYLAVSEERLEELRKIDRTIAKGELDGVEYQVSGPFNPDAPRYPKIDTHMWGAWPFLAIEMEGYGDLVAIDAGTGRSVRAVCFQGDVSPYDALRKLADVLEHVKFFDGDADDPPTSRA